MRRAIKLVWCNWIINISNKYGFFTLLIVEAYVFIRILTLITENQISEGQKLRIPIASALIINPLLAWTRREIWHWMPY